MFPAMHLRYSSLHFALPVLDNVFRGLGLERPAFRAMTGQRARGVGTT